MSIDLLIVEDNPKEALRATACANQAGISSLLVAKNLEEAKAAFESGAPRYVLTDLFFQAGNVAVTDFQKELVPIYDAYANRRFVVKDLERNPVRKALELVSGGLGMNAERYIEEVMIKVFKNPPSMIKAAREAISGIQEPEKYKEFLQAKEKMMDGTELPLGILVVRQARAVGAQVCVVTSTYHHGAAFEPIASLVGSYTDRVSANGEKDWAGGLTRLGLGCDSSFGGR